MRVALAKPLTEAQWAEVIRGYAKAFGWVYYHTHNSRHSPSGFPDCVMVRGNRIIFAELKKDKGGVVSDEQQEWLDALAVTGNVEVYVWLPRHEDDVKRILGNGRRAA